MNFNSLEDERRELWIGIIDEARQTDPDPDRAAACAYLLRHWIDSGADRRYRFTGTTSSKMFCGSVIPLTRSRSSAFGTMPVARKRPCTLPASVTPVRSN